MKAKTRRAAKPSDRYVLRLYITGTTPNSTRALLNLRKLCDKHLKGRVDLKVVDVYQRPQVARDEQILAAPTLIKELPLPFRRLVGDLSNEKQVVAGLGLILSALPDEDKR